MEGDLPLVYSQAVGAGLAFLRIPEMAGRPTQYVLCQYGIGNQIIPLAVISENKGGRLFGISPSMTEYDMAAVVSIAEKLGMQPREYLSPVVAREVERILKRK